MYPVLDEGWKETEREERGDCERKEGERERKREKRKRTGFDGNDESLILISLQFALKYPR